MIAFLEGTLLEKSTQYIILKVGPVGYKVFVTPEILQSNVDSSLAIFTYHKSGDDGQTLFGVPDFKSLQFFELLITVTGVGPKMALTIISSSKLELLEQAIVNGDSDIFTKMSGVGKKTAERIILELRSKVSGGTLLSSNSSHGEIFDALIGLGYNPREINEILSQVPGEQDTAEQLKVALKLLSKK